MARANHPGRFEALVLGAQAAGDIDDPVGRRVAADLARFEHAPGCAAQCWAAWAILKAVCDDAKLSLERLTKTTIYLRHAADLWIYEEIREAFLSGVGRDLPAAEFVAIPGPGPVPGAHIQIEAMAAEE